jgi:phenylacetate-CoA ligase
VLRRAGRRRRAVSRQPAVEPSALAGQPYWDERIETLPRDALGQLQLGRLQWQVRRCWEGSEFYRRRLGDAGVEPDDIRELGDLRRIPFVTRQELREDQLAHPPFGRYTVAPAETWRELHASIGSVGDSVCTIWSEADCENIAGLAARALWSFGVRAGDVVQNALPRGLPGAGLAVHFAGRRIGCLTVPIGAAPPQRQVDYLQRVESTVLVASPADGLQIAEALRKRGVSSADLPLQLGAFGEAGAENTSVRAEIERRLGLAVAGSYGAAEIGSFLAAECSARSGPHWAEDHHIVEIVDPESGEPLGEGEPGVVVISHLSREATPLLRYRTDHYARLTTWPCRCGRTHARSPGGVTKIGS